MWDDQGPTAVRGDWPLHESTGYAIEGNVKVRVPEWEDQWVQIKLEQSAVYRPAGGASGPPAGRIDGREADGVVYLAGRQTEWHVVE
jgi:hypothetical protein